MTAPRPWEMVPTTARPWEEGCLSHRIITINRPIASSPAVGVQPVVEYTPSHLTLIVAGVPAAIEVARTGSGAPTAHQPGDAWHRAMWRIFIDVGDAVLYSLNAPGLLLERDYVTDDAGQRYQVEEAYFHGLYGWRLDCERLQA